MKRETLFSAVFNRLLAGKSGMRLATHVLLLVIALKAATTPAQAGDILQSFQKHPIEHTAVILAIVVGLYIAQRWILPSDIYPWDRAPKRFWWNMLGLLIAILSGCIGLLVGRAISALTG